LLGYALLRDNANRYAGDANGYSRYYRYNQPPKTKYPTTHHDSARYEPRDSVLPLSGLVISYDKIATSESSRSSRVPIGERPRKGEEPEEEEPLSQFLELGFGGAPLNTKYVCGPQEQRELHGCDQKGDKDFS
jgi:hypothetical protein